MPTSHVVGHLEDFPPGHPVAVEIEGRKLLVTRLSDGVHAVGAICPHAGANLAEGVVDGDTVICPWHKAAFCLRTGRHLQPPAVDDLYQASVTVDGDVVRVATPAEVRLPPAESGSGETFVIVGAGAAGFACAQELRARNFAGRILLIGAEDELPYDRTIQSKYAISASDAGAEKSPLQDAAFYVDRKIERIVAEVTRLDAAAKSVTLADGTVHPYDRALVATGGAPVKLDLPGADLRNVFALRTKADADAIVQAAQDCGRAVILGASFIGMEAAAALRERGLAVTVVAKEAAPFEKQLGTEIGNVFRRLHESYGVEFRFSSGVERLEGDGAIQRVMLTTGEVLPADMFIAGTGVRPATAFLHGVALENGAVPVDETLQAAPGLYAAGDITLFPQCGGSKLRVEHWRVALQHGRLAARNMLGGSEPYTDVPVFWTIHFMKRLDYVGHADATHDVVIRGGLQDQKFIAYYVKDGIVKAAAGFGEDAAMAALIPLMTRRGDWTVDTLHPPAGTPEAVLAATPPGAS